MSRQKYVTVVYEIPMGENIQNLITDERAVCFSWSDALQRITDIKNDIPDLTEVIDWLESGKDVNVAIKELKEIQDEINTVLNRDKQYDK
jgi:predicted CopG family antitoxin